MTENERLRDAWVKQTRSMMVGLMCKQGCASSNDIHEAIANGYPAPPVVASGKKRGSIIAGVFSSKMFKPTGFMVPSIVPVHKRRKVCVFELSGEDDSSTDGAFV